MDTEKLKEEHPDIYALGKYLEDNDMTLGGISRGTDPNVSGDEVAKEILKALKAIEAGDYESVSPEELDKGLGFQTVKESLKEDN